jgi:NadR type nicotinamide-nucleotide adenylyltransferase
MEEKLKQITDTNRNCLKVVFYGPESTGKSSLARELAKFYDTSYVEEFSRFYAEARAQKNLKLTMEDVLPIAIGQITAENKQFEIANKVLICDTELLETKVYSEHYYNGFCPELVKKYANENTYDLYFLTYIDTIWEADGIRDQPKNRQQLFNRFEQALIVSQKPYVLVKGSFEERLSNCKIQIENLLKQIH